VFSLDEREAVRFVAGEIVEEASRQGTPLTDVERRMLFFNESAPEPDLAEVLAAFERECDEREYERKVSDLVRAAYRRADASKRDMWTAAIVRLEPSDAYVGVMILQAGLVRPEGISWRDLRVMARLIVIGLAGLGVLWFSLSKYLGHGPDEEELFFYWWLLALIAGVAYLVSRWMLGPARTDDLVDRVLDPLLGIRRWK
jgi:hypothetical protein